MYDVANSVELIGSWADVKSGHGWQAYLNEELTHDGSALCLAI